MIDRKSGDQQTASGRLLIDEALFSTAERTSPSAPIERGRSGDNKRPRSGSATIETLDVYDNFMSGAVDRWGSRSGHAPQPNLPSDPAEIADTTTPNGVAAFTAGHKRSANPHHGNTEQWATWMDGWDHESNRTAVQARVPLAKPVRP